MLFLGVSNNRVFFPPPSSILIGFSIINHPFWDTPMVPFRQAPEPFGHQETSPLSCFRNLVTSIFIHFPYRVVHINLFDFKWDSNLFHTEYKSV